MAALKIYYKSNVSRLLTDFLKSCLNAAHLHNSNLFPWVPFGYAAYMKEMYLSINQLLRSVNYEKFKWPFLVISK